MATLSLNPLS